jgi:hypothetical protein
MKSINQLVVLSFFMLSLSFAFGQEKTDCQIVGGEVDAIYLGTCKDGLASGKGMLTYSNSQGKYMFTGNFKKGKMHGEGQLFVFEDDVKKLLKEGVWKKSVYVGEKRDLVQPYRIKRRENIDRYSISRIANGNSVSFKFLQNGTKNNISNLTVEGDSGIKRGFAFDEKNIGAYDDIEYPFTCFVTYSTLNKMRTGNFDVRFEVVINEPGNWDIALNN